MSASVRGRRVGWVWTVSTACVLASASSAQAVRIATYNLLTYSGGRDTQFQVVTSGFDADIIVTQEVASGSAVNYFLNNILNSASGPGGYAAATFTDSGSLNNALFYRTSKFGFNYGDPSAHIDLHTSGRDIDRWKLRLMGYSSSAAEIYVYSMHLKASQGYESQRAAEAAVARADANALPAGTNFVYVGDLNIYDSFEDAYDVQLTGSMADNDGRAFDPINTPGSWHSNYAYRFIHTQSTRASFGGMDDRFDHILTSAALRDGEAFDYVPGTHKPYGQDGQHFNDDIDGDGFNDAVGLYIATKLREASDHLPVIADFEVPAVLSAPTTLDFGTVVQGSVAEAVLAVSNSGDVASFGYVDDLDYTLPAPPSGFYGPSGSFSEAAGGGGNAHTYQMDTGTVGPRSGMLTITGDGDNAPVSVSFTGTVISGDPPATHARPSTSGTVETTTGSLDFGSHPFGQFTTRDAEAYNYDWSATQAVMQVYDAQFSGPGASRFSVEGGFYEKSASSSPAVYPIAFDGTGATPNTTYTATLTLSTRDQPGTPGGIDLPDLTYSLSATVLDIEHARPSFSSGQVVTATTEDFGEHPVGQFVPHTVNIYNYGYTSGQAVLEVYDVQITGPDAGRFSVPDFETALVTTGSAAESILFDSTGADENASYHATVTFKTRDQSGTPGGIDLADMVVTAAATVIPVCNDPRFDANGDGDVDLGDYGIFITCYNGPGNPYPAGCGCHDADHDQDVDLSDYGAFISCYNGPANPADPACDD
jgi:endonuclease/exonuclease/phosphatase family metal-dependent hydrolase